MSAVRVDRYIILFVYLKSQDLSKTMHAMTQDGSLLLSFTHTHINSD